MVGSGAGRCLCQAILLWKDGSTGITSTLGGRYEWCGIIPYENEGILSYQQPVRFIFRPMAGQANQKLFE